MLLLLLLMNEGSRGRLRQQTDALLLFTILSHLKSINILLNSIEKGQEEGELPDL